MVGCIAPGKAAELNNAGIDHMGVVSKEKKVNLYSKPRVFVFPSSRDVLA
jgi:hypothetical protein